MTGIINSLEHAADAAAEALGLPEPFPNAHAPPAQPAPAPVPTRDGPIPSPVPGPVPNPAGGTLTLAGMGLTTPLENPAANFVNDFAQVSSAGDTITCQVINFAWRDLEAARGEYVVSDVLAALAQAKTLGVTVTLRVFAGALAPAWMLSDPAIGYVTVPNKRAGKPGADTAATWQFPQFWQPAYYQQELALQRALAAAFDGHSALDAVCIMTGICWTDENFNIGGSADVRTAYKAAGCTDAALQTNWNAAPTDYAAIWKNVPHIIGDISALVSVDDPTAAGNTVFPLAWAAKLRNAFGGRATLSNHGMDPTKTTGTNAECIDALAAMGGALSYQADGPTLLDPAFFPYAVTKGATQVELFPNKAAGGIATYTVAELQAACELKVM